MNHVGFMVKTLKKLCCVGDSNSQEAKAPHGPKPCASTNSATAAFPIFYNKTPRGKTPRRKLFFFFFN